MDNWYQNNLADYTKYINGDTGFCGDREPSTSSSSSNGNEGTGKTTTDYGAYFRIFTNKTPSFKCSNSSDLFTVSGASKGNKTLQYPIGFITADEVAYAGGVYNTTNQSYYLYTESAYWTMSSSYFGSAFRRAWVFLGSSNGSLGWNEVDYTYGVRPVINLRSDVTLSGSGTSTDPYTIVE